MLGRRRRTRKGTDRRQGNRARFGGLFVNKYIDGLPMLAALLDLSPSGMMVRKVLEPELGPTSFPVELTIPWTGEQFWVWTKLVRERGEKQALRFMGLAETDRARLAEIIAETLQAI